MLPLVVRLEAWLPVLAVFAVAVGGSVLHCSLAGAPPWGNALLSLYYVPIVIAAINLGLAAAVTVALLAGLAHAISSALGCGHPWIGFLTETAIYVCVAVTAAKFTRMHETAVLQSSGKGPRPQNLVNVYEGIQGAQQVPVFSQIVAGLIHRFRTPVSSIEGAVELLEDRYLPEDKREEFVRIIHKESHHLERALSDVLDFTQPKKPRWQSVDLSRLLDEVIRLAGPREHGPYFLFRKDIPPDLPRLTCDPEQIGQMLLNLLMNSIQATPGGGQIAIVAREEAGGVVITIKDHGRGIAPDVAGRIFDPFFTTRENALGLGLTVARQIATAHCGTIAVLETSEKGTRVSVRLPLGPVDAHDHRPHSDC